MGRFMAPLTLEEALPCTFTALVVARFSATMPVSRLFVSFVRGMAKIGQTFHLLGQGFTGATSVSTERDSRNLSR